MCKHAHTQSHLTHNNTCDSHVIQSHTHIHTHTHTGNGVLRGGWQDGPQCCVVLGRPDVSILISIRSAQRPALSGPLRPQHNRRLCCRGPRIRSVLLGDLGGGSTPTPPPAPHPFLRSQVWSGELWVTMVDLKAQARRRPSGPVWFGLQMDDQSDWPPET